MYGYVMTEKCPNGLIEIAYAVMRKHDPHDAVGVSTNDNKICNNHDMESLPGLLILCEGIPPVTLDYPNKGQVIWSIDILSVVGLNIRWKDCNVGDDLRRHSAQTVSVLCQLKLAKYTYMVQHHSSFYLWRDHLV